jgi:hypothetical protein
MNESDMMSAEECANHIGNAIFKKEKNFNSYIYWKENYFFLIVFLPG